VRLERHVALEARVPERGQRFAYLAVALVGRNHSPCRGQRCGNGAESSPVPVEPNIARFSGVSARFTSIPSAAQAIMPASSTADGSSSLS
jgi:hypothetical protein